MKIRNYRYLNGKDIFLINIVRGTRNVSISCDINFYDENTCLDLGIIKKIMLCYISKELQDYTYKMNLPYQIRINSPGTDSGVQEYR